MPKLLNQLEIGRCPHCRVDKPRMNVSSNFRTSSHEGGNQRFWRTYQCTRCGGVVLAASVNETGNISEMYPDVPGASDLVPEPAQSYLQQAMDTLHAPAGSVMLCASAVDAMLKEKSYKDGSLYSRINQAAADHLITQEMARWAHEVRLDANDQRHADENAPLPTTEDAQKCVDFALALAEFLFVLPSRVQRGLANATQS